jgi:hypothetical protein
MKNNDDSTILTLTSVSEASYEREPGQQEGKDIFNSLLGIDDDHIVPTQFETSLIEESVFTWEESLVILNEVYEDCPLDVAIAISRNEQIEMDYNTSTLSYGEISFKTFDQVLRRLESLGYIFDNNSRFIDIGSGVGKLVIYAAILHNFAACHGIEILSSLYQVSRIALSRWTDTCVRLKLRRKRHIDVQFFCGDALKLNWDKSSLIFLHATAFDDAMMTVLSDKIKRSPPNSYIVTISRPLQLDTDYFELLQVFELLTSWGIATAFIYKRTAQVHVDHMNDYVFLRSLGIEY